MYIYYPSQNILLAYIIHCNVFHYAFSGRCIMYFDHIPFLLHSCPMHYSINLLHLSTSTSFTFLSPFFFLDNPVDVTNFVYKRMGWKFFTSRNMCTLPVALLLKTFPMSCYFHINAHCVVGTITDSRKSAE